MYQIKRLTAIPPGIIIFLILIISPLTRAQTPPEFIETTDSGFYYTIQKGDTLWDLSQRFYHSQWDWPGLWEMNKEIKNPHWITPGKKIQIFLKQAPVSQAAIASPITSAEPAKSPPLPIPPSFSYPEISRLGFIRKTREPSLGKIIQERDGNLMMAVQDIIYINPTGAGSLIPGHIYQVFTTEKLKEKFGSQIFTGIKHLIKAEIELLDHKGDYATAMITKSYGDVNAGDQIMAFYERDSLFPVQENPAPIDAAIVCSEDNTLMINDYKIAFINQGRQHRIQVGQIYSILQKNPSDRSDRVWPKNPQSAAPPLEPLNSGKLIVLHTEEIASTVMILSSKRDIHPGDYVN